MKAGTLITVFVAFVMLSAGLTVMEEFSEAANESEMPIGNNDEPIADTCMGVFGCGEGPFSEFPFEEMFMLVAIPFAIVLFQFMRGGPPHGTTGSESPPDGVTLVKNQYVDGDIETVLDFEERLEDAMDGDDE